MPSRRSTQICLSVIIPVYNDSANLAICYQALAASTRLPDEIIVVDDGSTQSLPPPPPTLPVKIMRMEPGPQGSYVARNKALEHATGDLIVFVDADVAVHPEALASLEYFLLEHPEYEAVFGSYDDTPAAPQWVSRYKNLAHHWVHHHSPREAGTFWSGLGGIWRKTILQVGKFDTSAKTLRDVELGMRLRRQGFRIALCPEIQGTHLKRWTFFSMIRSDIRDRAIPWTHLIVRERRLTRDLNLDHSNRTGASLAWIMEGALLATFWHWGALVIAFLAFAAEIALHWRLYTFMRQHGGFRFMAGAIMLHILYLLYSSATFLLAGAWALWQETRRRESTR